MIKNTNCSIDVGQMSQVYTPAEDARYILRPGTVQEGAALQFADLVKDRAREVGAILLSGGDPPALDLDLRLVEILKDAVRVNSASTHLNAAVFPRARREGFAGFLGRRRG